MKDLDSGEDTGVQPKILVTEYEDDKTQVKTAPPLHRSRTDSIISYSNPGNTTDNSSTITILLSGLAEAVGSTFYITKEGNIDLSGVLKVKNEV